MPCDLMQPVYSGLGYACQLNSILTPDLLLTQPVRQGVRMVIRKPLGRSFD